MTREAAIAVMIAIAVLIVALGAFGWWRRTRRDRGTSAPFAEAPESARELSRFTVLYVATTQHGEPLERLAIRGLGYRSRGTVTVLDAGVALDLTGQPRMFLATGRLLDVAQATVAIDRVVERDGLTRLTWRTDDDTIVDSYLRPQDASALALADAVRSILTPTPTGTDA